MPLVRPCENAPCPDYALPGERYCDAHLFIKKVSQKRYAPSFEATARQAIYNTARWKKTAKMAKTLGDNTCVLCGYHAPDGKGLVADHCPTPILECLDPYDLDNLRVLCLVCSGEQDGARRYR